MQPPPLLSPIHWLGAIDSLPRLGALLVLGASASMMVLGLRYFRYYVFLFAVAVGVAGGIELAALMHVRPVFVAVPTTLFAIGLMWPIRKLAPPVIIGFIAACALGSLVTHGFDVDAFWITFAAGLFGGVALAVLAQRFAIAILCSACGTMGVVASLGAVVRASSGWLAPGGYGDEPIVYVIGGAIAFVAALVVQVVLEAETPAQEAGDGGVE